MLNYSRDSSIFMCPCQVSWPFQKRKPMDQITFVRNILKLKVRKSPLIIRVNFFLVAFVFFIFPVMGMISSIAGGNRFHISYLIGIGLFSLLGFYLLRISLWNSFGEEILQFGEHQISYEANYGWFKDGKKTITLENAKYSFLLVGYEDDSEGILQIENDPENYMCRKSSKKRY
jgi:hypothetical protein